MLDMVEKPPAEEAPSDLGSRGRYLVYARDLRRALDRTTSGVGGEIQLTDAINLLAQRAKRSTPTSTRARCSTSGKKLDYLKATIELALSATISLKPLIDYVARAR